jgi:transposase
VEVSINMIAKTLDKEDARHQTLTELHERRKQVIRLFKKGYGVMRIAELSGLSYPTVRNAIDRFEQGGEAAIKPANRGRKMGEGRIMSEADEEKIKELVQTHSPSELAINAKIWDRGAVLALIERECEITMSVRGVGNYLKRWNFNPKKQSKPVKRAPVVANVPVISAWRSPEQLTR